MTGPVTGDQLLSLLPALYRLRDIGNNGALSELMDVLAGQVQVLQAELDQLYDDQFVETSADWVAPYIGDLIGYRPMYGVVPAIASPRADVANTIRYRRRKGTGLMLEQLARDVTRWPAREVEFFERVASAQFMNHIRPAAAASPDLRQHEVLGLIGGAFDDLAHTVDVRRIATAAGFRPTLDAVGGPGAARHNISNVGVFLWTTAALPLTAVPVVAAAADGLRFRLDQLGRDLPIFAASRPVESLTPIQVEDVPMPLGRRFLFDHLQTYYGPDASLLLETFDGVHSTPVPIDTIRVSDLSDHGTGWAHQPPTGFAAVDPVLGRVYLGDPLALGSTLHATWYYGEAAPTGAGSRDRGDDPVAAATVAHGTGLQAALTGVAATGGTVLLQDSWTSTGALTLTAPPAAPGLAAVPVTLRGANLTRPAVSTTGPLRLDIGTGGVAVLDGVLVTGGAVVLDEAADTEPRTVTLRDCTLVPGQRRAPDGSPDKPGAASLVVLHPFAVVTLERCVTGPIVAVDGAQVTLVDCIIDADGQDRIAYAGRAEPTGGGLRVVAGPADELVGDGSAPGGQLAVTSSTVIGGVHAELLDASNCLLLARLATGSLWPAAIWAHRRQQGCIRFSWLPTSSRTGRRFHCEPDDHPGVVPTLTSTRFGDPGYCQLDVVTPDAIRRGTDDESEMGVTHGLFIPQRESNLRIRLTEYLRFGLQAGFGYAT